MPSSSTTYASSSSSASTSASASPAAASSSGSAPAESSRDPRNAVVGGVLGVLALLLLVGILLVTLRVRRRQKIQHARNSILRPFHGTAVLDKRHPAARIVPFGTPGNEGHVYRHTPGKDMRIAIRRPDGAWDFTEPGQPFTPTGISDPVPSPVSSIAPLLPSSKRQRESTPTRDAATAISEYKEQESRAAQMIRLGYDARDNDLELGDGYLPHPPPAYGTEPTTGPYATYRPSTSPRNLPS